MNDSSMYYIKVDGSLLLEYTYSNESDAKEQAESLELKEYTIIEWETE